MGEPKKKVLAAPPKSAGTSKLASGHLLSASCLKRQFVSTRIVPKMLAS